MFRVFEEHSHDWTKWNELVNPDYFHLFTVFERALILFLKFHSLILYLCTFFET